MSESMEPLATFLADWPESPEGNRQGFLYLRDQLLEQAGTRLEFHPRPGLTYSLRASRSGHARPLYVMVDVIDEEPRWLSVCFFGDTISDPEERGAFVPDGLLGEDALCFDLETCTTEDLAYVQARIREAWQAAKY